MATRATRRLLTLALALALALPKSTLPPVLPLPTLVPALPPRPAPVCVAGLLRPSRVVAGMPQCLRVPSRTSLRSAVHSQACSPQCTAPTPRFLWTPTAPALCASPRTLNSRFGKASSRSNVSFAFGVVFAHADIDAFETRALYVQRVGLALLPSSVLKIVVGEVGKGLGNGRLRALLGGKGLAAFVQKTGYGVAVRVGSSRGLRLVGSLWRRHKATVISGGHRHLWKLLFLISATLAVLAYSLPHVLSFGVRDIDAIESALAWAFSGLQLALPLLPHGRPLGLVVGELAKTLGRGKLRKLAAGIGVDAAFLRLVRGIAHRLFSFYLPKALSRIYARVFPLVLRQLRKLNALPRSIQWAGLLLLGSVSYLARPHLPAPAHLRVVVVQLTTVASSLSLAGRPPPPTPPPPLPG